jgi:Na+/proline symporter
MLRFLPVGWMGLMLGGLVAANSSTILTHLNWGASYLVHDFYRRFLNKGAPEHHYVMAGRVATVLLFVLSSSLVFALDTAQGSFNIILQIGGGTGLLYLLRWFWWRVNAWCEIVAMIMSFLVSLVLLILTRNGVEIGTAQGLIIVIAVTTVCWIATAFVGPQTDPEVLANFYRKIHPFGPGWKPVAAQVKLTPAEIAEDRDNFPLALVGWVSGCTMIWSALFTVGNFLYGRTDYALGLLAVFAISGFIVIRVVQKLWR